MSLRGDEGALLCNSRAALESGIRRLCFFLCRAKLVHIDFRYIVFKFGGKNKLFS